MLIAFKKNSKLLINKNAKKSNFIILLKIIFLYMANIKHKNTLKELLNMPLLCPILYKRNLI